MLRYVAYLDNLDKRATTATTFTFKDLMPGEEYELGVRAFDGQLDNSDKSKLLVTTKK